jgi:steroid 5-alpha reductase family enzyme
VAARRALVRGGVTEDALSWGAIGARVGEAWALAAAGQFVLWLVQQRTRNAGIVDVGWAFGFAAVVALFAATAVTPVAVWAPIAVVAVAWSLRLGGYLVARGAASSPEEGRYADLRARWGARASGRFFIFFQAQAALVGVLSIALVVPFVELPSCGWLRFVGAAVSACGVIGEATADAQLARWKRDPDNRGKVCDTGLWSWSRHPNYFFEWCVWLGYAIHGLAFLPYGAIAIVPQALLLCSILFVTGIPPTEKQSLASRGDLYRAYQARVSKFVPWPPKRS